MTEHKATNPHMSIDIQEFINPKSMITPSVAAAIIATAGGAFFSIFTIGLAWSLPLLSLFVGCMVFYSKELAEPSTTKLTKGFFYILNCIILFATATATHTMLGKSPLGQSPPDKISPPANNLFSVSRVYAEDISGEISASFKQKRPLFHNWIDIIPNRESSDTENNCIVMTVTNDFGELKNIFVELGFIVPDYMIRVRYSDEQKNCEPVTSVIWKLPAEYFDKSQVVATNNESDFAIDIKAWMPFEIGAELKSKSGQTLHLQKFIDFHTTARR